MRLCRGDGDGAGAQQARVVRRAQFIRLIGGEDVEKSKYEENARKIIDLAEGMTDAQWSRIRVLINRCIDEKKAKVTFEKPERLDLLMKQNFIL